MPFSLNLTALALAPVARPLVFLLGAHYTARMTHRCGGRMPRGGNVAIL
jgi:hypothetical protein